MTKKIKTGPELMGHLNKIIDDANDRGVRIWYIQAGLKSMERALELCDTKTRQETTLCHYTLLATLLRHMSVGDILRFVADKFAMTDRMELALTDCADELDALPEEDQNIQDITARGTL